MVDDKKIKLLNMLMTAHCNKISVTANAWRTQLSLGYMVVIGHSTDRIEI